MASLTYTPADPTVVTTVGPFSIYSDSPRTVLVATTAQPTLTGTSWVAQVPGSLANGTYYPSVPVTYTDGTTVPDLLPLFVLPAGALISLTEIRGNLNLPNPSQPNPADTELQGFLDAALDVASHYVGPLAAQTYTETHYGLRSTDRVLLDNAPVASVMSVSVLYGLGMPPFTYTGTDMLLDPATGVLRFLRAFPMYGDITVTYTAGPAALTPAVRLGVLELVAHWYQRSQEGSLTGGTSGGGGGIGQSYDQADVTPGVYAGVPYSVLDKFRAHFRIQGIG